MGLLRSTPCICLACARQTQPRRTQRLLSIPQAVLVTNLWVPVGLLFNRQCCTLTCIETDIANSTSNVSDSTLIAATNITVPFISKVPGFGKSTQSFIDTTAGVVLAVFIISLIGNGLSFILSIAAFIMPSNGKIHAAGAGITMLSSQMLQIAAITSTSIANGVSSGINSSSSVSGLSASVGGKFLAMIWVGYIAAQAANIYWTTTWFVKFRKTSFQRRQRTAQEMQAGYKAIGKEIRSDFRVRKAEYEDTEVLVNGPVEVRHWDDDYQKM